MPQNRLKMCEIEPPVYLAVGIFSTRELLVQTLLKRQNEVEEVLEMEGSWCRVA